MKLDDIIKITLCKYGNCLIDSLIFEEFLYQNLDEIKNYISGDELYYLISFDYKQDNSSCNNFIYKICYEKFPDYLFNLEICCKEIEEFFIKYEINPDDNHNSNYYYSELAYFESIIMHLDMESKILLQNHNNILWSRDDSFDLDRDMVKIIPRKLGKIILYASNNYPPAIAFTKENFDNFVNSNLGYEQFITIYCYYIIYILNLFQKKSLPFFKIREKAESLGGYNLSGYEPYIIKYENNYVSWVSYDHVIYQDHESCFELPVKQNLESIKWQYFYDMLTDFYPIKNNDYS